MFKEILNPFCESLKLEGFDGFEEKFIAITTSLKITAIFCQVENKQDISFHPNEQGSLRAEAVLIPGGDLSLVQSSLSLWKQDLILDLNDYIYEQSDFITTQQNLRKWKKICREGYKINNTSDRLNYGWDLKFKCCFDNRWINKDFGELLLSQDCIWEIRDHFESRKAFYADMAEAIDEAHETLTELMNLDPKSYKWNSDHPELEIAELVDSIEKFRLGINPDKNGLRKIFRHEFYSFFGLSDKNHDQKLQHLRNRKSGNSVFDILRGASHNNHTANDQKNDLIAP